MSAPAPSAPNRSGTPTGSPWCRGTDTAAMMRWLRAPLLHFVAGGAALFWLVHGSHPPAAPVVVTAEDVSRLRLDYTRETGLEPTAADEAALVERAVEEELLFREAVARGLDQHDRS